MRISIYFSPSSPQPPQVRFICLLEVLLTSPLHSAFLVLIMYSASLPCASSCTVYWSSLGLCCFSWPYQKQFLTNKFFAHRPNKTSTIEVVYRIKFHQSCAGFIAYPLYCSLNGTINLASLDHWHAITCRSCSTHPCRGLWETGRCGHSHWSSISSGQSTLGRCHSFPRRPPQSRWLSPEVDRCPASPPTPTGGTRSWSHTPSAFWETLARWVGENQ